MTQAELNNALHFAIRDNDPEQAEEWLGRGADQLALLGGWNALHRASSFGRAEIMVMLMGKGGVSLEALTDLGNTALNIAAFYNKPKVWKLLITKGADLRVRDKDNRSALSHYGNWANFRQGLDKEIKVKRVAELKAFWRAGCHPSQVQRRKDENWDKRWPLMNVAYGCGFLLLAHKNAALKATALPTNAALPPVPTGTDDQRRAQLHQNVFGHMGLFRIILGFIQNNERVEDDECLL